MKGLLVLLCAVALAQGRSGVVTSNARVAAALGENPWLVHLRLAVSTSGFLNTCAGSLISNRWVLTSSSCLRNSRFIWVRYGVVEVISPELVTETATVRDHPTADLALISINRNVEFSDNINAVSLSESDEVPATARFCGFGAADDGTPGETLNCFDVNVEAQEDGTLSTDEDVSTDFDLGAPLVSEGVQIGVLVQGSEGRVFVSTAEYISWIQEVTGLGQAVPEEDAGRVVNIVN